VVIRKRTKRPKGNNCLVHVTFAFLVVFFRAEVVRPAGCASETERCICAASSYSFVHQRKMKEKMREKVITVKSARLPFAPLRLSVVFISLSFALLQNVIVSLFFRNP
jgi:hypothetical protein